MKSPAKKETSGILRFATLRTMPEREADAAAWFHEK